MTSHSVYMLMLYSPFIPLSPSPAVLSSPLSTSTSPFFSCKWVHQLEKAMAPPPVLLPGKSHGRRSLVGCSPWGHQESDATERLQFHFSLSYIREGNGSPLQCSCLENLGDGGAWWAAVYGVAQSRTQMKQLSSTSSTELPQ